MDSKSKNSIKNNSNSNLSYSQNPKDKVIERIMQKYNVSLSEAEKILSAIEEISKKNKVVNEHFSEEPHNQKISSHNNQYSNHILRNDDENDSQHPNKNTVKVRSSFLENKENVVDELVITEQNNYDSPSLENNHSNIDKNRILDSILPNDDQKISIKLEHVDLTFEVEKEKIDTLKETFIRTIKRNKSEKIKIHAIKDVSFQIYKGEKVGLIGYNGAGKSTLLGLISGIYYPDKGSVIANGKISPLLSLGAGFDHNFSGRVNIMLNGAVLGYSREFLESKIDEIIEFSELGEFIDIPIKNYSSGMLAKLGFSIATAVNPDILIIDEILGVGDATFARKSADKIRSLMDGGTTVILVSHSIPQIRKLCDKAIWIDNGSVKAIGEVNKICDEYLKDAEKATKKQLENIQFR